MANTNPPVIPSFFLRCLKQQSPDSANVLTEYKPLLTLIKYLGCDWKKKKTY